jgi:hypothetical protein
VVGRLAGREDGTRVFACAPANVSALVLKSLGRGDPTPRLADDRPANAQGMIVQDSIVFRRNPLVLRDFLD